MNINKLALSSILLIALSGCASTSTNSDDNMEASKAEAKSEAMVADSKMASDEAATKTMTETKMDKAEMVKDASAEAEPMAEAKKEMADKSDKKAKKNKKTLAKTFTASRADAHAAALAAMKQYGFKVKKSDDNSIEGKRSNKVGLAVGSGGEKIYITLDEAADGATEIGVRTKKTFVGIAGQKNWNDEVMAAISETLG